jgi:methionyl-tRNA formyltransferase
MRKWFEEDAEMQLEQLVLPMSLKAVCQQYQVPYHTTRIINCKETRELMSNMQADLGLSLGNGYIGEKVFSIPQWGMLNIHHEVLPEFQGARSVIWQIYQNSIVTGYTIHRIDKQIDTGSIIYCQSYPIEFKNSLKETASYNYAQSLVKSVTGLIDVLMHFDSVTESMKVNNSPIQYSTPTFWQYLQMKLNHRRLAKKCNKAKMNWVRIF